MIIPTLSSFFHKLLLIIHIQILLFFICLPLSVHWGLSISLMTIVGNIIFLPFLSIFLLLSLILFFSELCAIPNTLLATFFNHYVEGWFYLLKYGSTDWLICFASPGILLLSLIPLIGFIVHQFIKQSPLLQKTVIHALCLCIICIFLKCQQTPHIVQWPYRDKNITFYTKSNRLYMSIPCCRLPRKISDWFFFDIQPLIAKKFGLRTINTIILTTPTKASLHLIQKNKELLGYEKLITCKPNQAKKTSYITFIS